MFGSYAPGSASHLPRSFAERPRGGGRGDGPSPCPIRSTGYRPHRRTDRERWSTPENGASRRTPESAFWDRTGGDNVPGDRWPAMLRRVFGSAEHIGREEPRCLIPTLPD